MPDKYEIALPDLSKVDPDHDGLPGITIKRLEVEERLKQLARYLVHTPLGSPKWYDALYLLLLEYGTNLKYLNPVFAKIPGAIVISSGLVLLIKYWATRIGVKVKDLKDPETL